MLVYELIYAALDHIALIFKKLSILLHATLVNLHIYFLFLFLLTKTEA